MTENRDQNFLKYYTSEIKYLRNEGQAFAKAHPHAAKSLDISDQESSDPHTEQLIESFAFLTAHIHQHIDNSMSEVATGLYHILFPHLTQPMPSMAIAHFTQHHHNNYFENQSRIEKGSFLFAKTADDVTCKFQTVYPVTLTPLSVTSASIVQGHKFLEHDSHLYISLSLETPTSKITNLVSIGDLDFHINAPMDLAHIIYEALFAQKNASVYMNIRMDEYSKLIKLPSNSLIPKGFDISEMMLPIPSDSTNAHALLQEFFNFPEKFMFFTIKNLENIFNDLLTIDQSLQSNPNNMVNITFYIQTVSNTIKQQSIHHENFLLGCTPIINLFPKTTDPLRIDYRKTEYRLIPDQRRDNNFEIYSIDSVIVTDETTNEAYEMSPYFSMRHHEANQSLFWYSKRVNASSRNIPGSDLYLSFVNLKFNPKTPPSRIVYAHTWCTNRHHASTLSANATFFMDTSISVSSITCLNTPTASYCASMDGESLWKMVSLLSSNLLFLESENDTAINLLKERLYLYAKTTAYEKRSHALIDALKSIETQPITRRASQHVWKGLLSGIEVTLSCNANPYNGSAHFLLASILQKYITLSISINSFAEFVLKGKNYEGEWMRWPAFNGIKPLL